MTNISTNTPMVVQNENICNKLHQRWTFHQSSKYLFSALYPLTQSRYPYLPERLRTTPLCRPRFLYFSGVLWLCLGVHGTKSVQIMKTNLLPIIRPITITFLLVSIR